MKSEYNRLGTTDLKISKVGLGTWQFSQDWGVTEYQRAKGVINRAVELGINFFDTAMYYGGGLSEYYLGRALRETGVSRDNVVITTKVLADFLNPSDIYKSVRRAIELLGLKYVDVVMPHWPPCWHNFPTYKYARALEKLVTMGLVNYLGLSNFPLELIESFRESLSSTDIQVLQVRYNLLEREAEEQIIPYAEKNHFTVQAWSPIAKGALTGKYSIENLPKFDDVREADPIFHPDNFSKIAPLIGKINEIGKKYNKKPVQVALNWLMRASPTVVPIPGAKTNEQVEDFVGAVGWTLQYEDWVSLNELSKKVDISYSIHYVTRKIP
ncbi:MAG: aldo/keto reductase [Aigarchaeota archaeon]|nr:aldo/keto reductase [Candidatus Calditenuaceae archaeon]